MTDREARAARNQERSLAAFLAKKSELDALLTELQQASADHFGADPEEVLWGEAAWLWHASPLGSALAYLLPLYVPRAHLNFPGTGHTLTP